ncbi:MAG: RsmE family RNA methyltransferase, partial [Chitinophagaceae bacterium]
MRNILVSAMLQSQQCWLPVLHEPIAYELLFRQEEVAGRAQKFIAHCIETEKRKLTQQINSSLPSQIILIGPEGDFTPAEIELATLHHFNAVALGDTRLRAETAGVVAASLLRLV